MVDILQAPGLVAADGLQMCISIAGDTDLRPCRRDRQLRDALEVAPPDGALAVSEENDGAGPRNPVDVQLAGGDPAKSQIVYRLLLDVSDTNFRGHRLSPSPRKSRTHDITIRFQEPARLTSLARRQCSVRHRRKESGR